MKQNLISFSFLSLKMKAVIALLALVAAASAAVQPLKPYEPLKPLAFLKPLEPLKPRYLEFEEGQYIPEHIYSGDSGQYRNDNGGSQTSDAYNAGDSGQYNTDYANSGAYNPDENGQYRHENSGYYIHDNSGDYIHIHNPYEHDDNPYEHQEVRGGDYKRPPPIRIFPKVDGIPPAGGYGPPVALKQGNAAGFYDNRNYKIIRKIEHVGQDLYDYLYETENGIYAEEDGKIGNKGTKEEAIRAKGYFTYTGPDNIIYTVNYTADENGFVPQADHIPTPPPLPEAIVRSLAWKKAKGILEKRK